MNMFEMVSLWFFAKFVTWTTTEWKLVNTFVVKEIKKANVQKGTPVMVPLFLAFGVSLTLFWTGKHWRIEMRFGDYFESSQRLINGAWAYNSKVATELSNDFKEKCGAIIKELPRRLSNPVQIHWDDAFEKVSLWDRVTGKTNTRYLENYMAPGFNNPALFFNVLVEARKDLFGKHTGNVSVDIPGGSLTGVLSGVFNKEFSSVSGDFKDLNATQFRDEVNTKIKQFLVLN